MEGLIWGTYSIVSATYRFVAQKGVSHPFSFR